jgi:hypothetical protein
VIAMVLFFSIQPLQQINPPLRDGFAAKLL